jgi:hypothetical protein
MSLCVWYAKTVTLSYEYMVLARLRHAWEPGKQFYKMAVPLHQCTKLEQRSVVRFLCCEGVNLTQIHRRMRIQYGDRCMSRTQVYEWTEKFKNGVTSVEDSPRPSPAFTAVTEDNICILVRLCGQFHSTPFCSVSTPKSNRMPLFVSLPFALSHISPLSCHFHTFATQQQIFSGCPLILPYLCLPSYT